MNEILELDKEWLIYINSFHAPWLDPIMFWITKTEMWIPLYVFLLYLIIKTYKTKSWIVLIGVGLTILIADQVTASIMKPYFARLRPSHDPALDGIIHLVNGYKGGLFGFASGHAANTFGIALFFWLTFRLRYRWIAFMFIWAALMTYTRMYLGVHYPFDILVGSIVGLIAGFVAFKVSQYLITRYGATYHLPVLPSGQ